MSSPTVSWRPARNATSTLVPPPSVLMTRVGVSRSAGTRTIPPKAPTSPRASAVRVDAAAWTMRALARSKASRSTPAARYRSAGIAGPDLEVHQVLELPRARGDFRRANLVEPIDRKPLHRVRAHSGAVDH